jgi:A/G-specific adenine glycosylase
VSERREAPYAGSNRFYRGRAIAALRDLPAGSALALAELGGHVKADWGPDDLPWLRSLVDGLARDGLLVVEDGMARLP